MSKNSNNQSLSYLKLQCVSNIVSLERHDWLLALCLVWMRAYCQSKENFCLFASVTEWRGNIWRFQVNLIASMDNEAVSWQTVSIYWIVIARSAIYADVEFYSKFEFVMFQVTLNNNLRQRLQKPILPSIPVINDLWRCVWSLTETIVPFLFSSPFLIESRHIDCKQLWRNVLPISLPNCNYGYLSTKVSIKGFYLLSS